MKKINLLLFLFLFLCALTTTAENTYPNLGGLNQDFFSDDVSKFNNFITDDTISDTYPVNDPQQVPLVEDLNNDGINEIIVLQGTTIGFYNVEDSKAGTQFKPITGYTTTATVLGDFFSNMVLYDIDSDSNKEVILFSVEDEYLYILNYNGSHVNNTGYSTSLVGMNWDAVDNGESSDVMLGCGDSDGCILLWNDHNKGQSFGLRELRAVQFDNTNISLNINTLYSRSYTDANAVCLPKIASVPFSNGRYFNTMIDEDRLRLFKLVINSSEHITSDYVQNPHTILISGIDCDRGKNTITSPLLMDYTIDSGLEVAYAYQRGSNAFKLIIYKESLSEIDLYPDVFTGLGKLISNPFKSNAFIDSDDSSICVAGYDKTLGDYGAVNFVCADQISENSGINQNVRFLHYLDSDYKFNMSIQDYYSPLSSSINSLDSTSISQILTPYGVFSLEDRSKASLLSNCYLNTICEADLIYKNLITSENSIISVDASKTGTEDLIALTDTNMYYIDDKEGNDNAHLGYCSTISPDNSRTWALHEGGTTVLNPDAFVNTNKISEVSIIEGKDQINTYSQTFFKDNVGWGIKEEGKELEFYFNISVENLGLSLSKLVMSAKWLSDEENDVLSIYLKNNNTGEWELQRTITNSTGYKWFNFTGCNVSNYLTADKKVEFYINDSLGSDAQDSYLYIDYLVGECYGALESSEGNQSNEVRLRIKPIDPEGDNVKAKASLYYGETNQQDTNYSSSFASGTEIPINGLLPNLTTSSSILRIYYTDADNYPNTPNYQDFTFRVAPNGNFYYDSSICKGITQEEFESGEAGECSFNSDCPTGYTCINSVCVTLPSSCDSATDCPTNFNCNASDQCEALPTTENNIINESITDLSTSTKIPISVLILMIVAGIIYSVYKEEEIPNNVKFPISIILGLLTIGIAVKLELLGIIWLILFIMALLAGISILVARALRGS